MVNKICYGACASIKQNNLKVWLQMIHGGIIYINLHFIFQLKMDAVLVSLYFIKY